MRQRESLYRNIFLSILLIIFHASAFSQTIKGKVFDPATGEPLVGANVMLSHTHFVSVVQLDGSFTFHHVPAGKYEIVASTIGYTPSTPQTVEVVRSNDVRIINIALSSKATLMQEVQISTLASGDLGSRRAEQRADMVQNLVSARAIQLSPDITVANALQRVSGVTIQRDNTGDGRYAIIRGMDQRYNSTLVNGIKIPSPDDKYRFVPMNIFPAEMLERLEVIKALTPNMEGDAIGGTMNLVMKNAPDKFLLTANGSAGYSTLFSSNPFTAFDHGGINKLSPAEIHGNQYAAPVTDFPLNNLHFHKKSNPINNTLGMTIGDRFLDKKLGIILSASYQNLYKGSESQRIVPDAQPQTTPGPNTLNPSDAYVRQFSTQTTRIGLQNKIDYVINSRHKLSLFNLYLHQDEYETRFTPDSTVGLNSSGGVTHVEPEYRSRWQIQNIYNGTLHGDHELGNQFKVDWTGVYSLANQKIPDMATYKWVESDSSSNGKTVNTTKTIPYGTANVMTRRWSHNQDQDWSGYGNATYTPTLFGETVDFQAGGMYRYKTRDNYYNQYDIQSPAPSGTPFISIDATPLYFQAQGQNQGSTTAETSNTYTAHEKVAAGYVQTKFTLFQKLQVLGGVRVENTKDDYRTALPLTAPGGPMGEVHYTDVLPSAHLRYRLTHNQSLRMSYFKSISRPGFGDLVPVDDNSNDEFEFLGNPYLKHVRADNLDARYELFPGLADQVLIGAFYKHITNPIEYFVINANGPSKLYIKPQNTNEATNYGAEAVITKYFGIFGISANYTYTHSEVTTPKLSYAFVTGAGNQTLPTTQTRPLQGQANHAGNISLLLKDHRLGLDAQLAFAYTGDRIVEVSPYKDLDIWAKPFTQLDFSLEKTLTRHFTFFGKVNNLLNSPNKEYIKFPYSVVNQNEPKGYSLPFQDAGSNYTVAQRDIYKISFLGGIRYKF